MEADDASTPEGLLLRSPPPIEPTIISAHQSPEVVNSSNALPPTELFTQIPEYLFKPLIRQESPRQNFVALVDQTDPEFLDASIIPLPRPKETVAPISTSFAAPLIPKAPESGGNTYKNDCATRSDEALFEFMEEYESFEPQTPQLSMHNLLLSAPKSVISNLYSNLSHDPRTDGSIMTNWSDQNGLSTEQWSVHFNEKRIERPPNNLFEASRNGQVTIVEQLLEDGADVNAQGGQYGNALQAASYMGHLAVVELLLSQGADVNAQGGEYGNALQAASSRGAS
jgi:hypothetical protein